MNTAARMIFAVAAVSLAVATGIGAYASHGLDNVLDAATLRSVSTAVEYQFYHSFGLVAVGLLYDRHPGRPLMLAAILFGAGIVLFCGAIYGSALGAESLGPAAPLGGLCFIAAWLVLACAALRTREPS